MALRLLTAALLVHVVYAGCKTSVPLNPTISNFTCTSLDGTDLPLSRYYGKVVLVENVASMWGDTFRDYPQANELTARYAARGLVILGFPCNQFAFQENMGNGDILNLLKYVRPGNGFVPAFPMFQKVDVNGMLADPLFVWLRSKLPLPFDAPYGPFIMKQLLMLWEPASRTDIDWNFEKFLIGRNGLPIKRWSSTIATADPGLIADIEKALDNRTAEIEVLPDYAYSRAHTPVWLSENGKREL